MSRVVSAVRAVREAVRTACTTTRWSPPSGGRPRKLGEQHRAHLLVGVDEKRTCSRSSLRWSGLNRIAGILEAEWTSSRWTAGSSLASRSRWRRRRRVLPQREDEGDPEGAGPQGRQGQTRSTTSAEEIEQARMPKDVEEKASPGGAGRRRRRCRPCRPRPPSSRNYHRLAHRRALAPEDPREPRPQARRADPAQRTTTGSRDQGTASWSSSRARAGQEAQGDDSHLCRPSGASARPRSQSRSQRRQ